MSLLLRWWSTAAPALAAHLWQSTLFALAAALLTLAFRKNQARHRYWLWLAASLKFLLPFSLLAAIGNRLPVTQAPIVLNNRLAAAASIASDSFLQSPTQVISAAASATQQAPSHLFPALFVTLWLAGFLLVAFTSLLRWRKIAALARSATSLHSGREFTALRRIERATRLRRPIEIRASAASFEPGVFGIARPVLLWPQAISAHLTDAQIEAIVAHEFGHVRRRDNLAAAIHMLIEAIFWFHPLVWWIGTRLVGERERACDEQVLAFGSERTVYAEGILRTCEFCTSSPLACVSGVTGADLERRIIQIMTQRASRTIGAGKKLLLIATVFIALALPVSFGLFNAAASRELEATAAPIICHGAAIAQQAAMGSRTVTILDVKEPVSKPRICPKVLAARRAAAAAAAAALKNERQRAPG